MRRRITEVMVQDIIIAVLHGNHAQMLEQGKLLSDGGPWQVIAPETLAQV